MVLFRWRNTTTTRRLLRARAGPKPKARQGVCCLLVYLATRRRKALFVLLAMSCSHKTSIRSASPADSGQRACVCCYLFGTHTPYGPAATRTLATPRLLHKAHRTTKQKFCLDKCLTHFVPSGQYVVEKRNDNIILESWEFCSLRMIKLWLMGNWLMGHSSARWDIIKHMAWTEVIYKVESETWMLSSHVWDTWIVGNR